MTLDTRISSASLDALEDRLRRVAYVVTGDTSAVPAESASDTPAAARLRTLDRQLHSLSLRSQAVSEVLDLHADHPTLFHPSTDPVTSSKDLPPLALASLVSTHAQLYQQLALQLGILKDQSVPDPASAVLLVSLQPRIEKAAKKQAEQAAQFADLRTESAQALESWYSNGVLGMAERWADWEERIRDVEILVRRLEALQRKDDEVV